MFSNKNLVSNPKIALIDFGACKPILNTGKYENRIILIDSTRQRLLKNVAEPLLHKHIVWQVFEYIKEPWRRKLHASMYNLSPIRCQELLQDAINQNINHLKTTTLGHAYCLVQRTWINKTSYSELVRYIQFIYRLCY